MRRGIQPADVTTATGDTNTTPFGSGTIGARAGSYTVSAVALACREIKAKIARILAHDANITAGVADFEFARGYVTCVRDPAIRKSFAEVAHRVIMASLNLPPGEQAGLEYTSFFEADTPMICFSCHAAIVEVDVNTGRFNILRYVTSEDVGRMINPQIVEGQVQGGVVQGLSNAMFEQFVYDDNGQQLTGTFQNYRLATAADVPHIEVTDASTPCPYTPLGTRGLGEGIPGPVPGALTNAVCDALAPLGVEITELPLRPNTVWKAIQEAKRA